ncbi:hypothetical protein H0H93_000797, partial [Arthromyces matolae]
PITSYKKKEEFEILATALEISAKGTVQELTQRIKDHIEQHHEDLQKNPRFSGLLSTGRRRKERPTSNGVDSHSQAELAVNSTVVDRRQEASYSCDPEYRVTSHHREAAVPSSSHSFQLPIPSSSQY